jgi:hypothetical protein
MNKLMVTIVLAMAVGCATDPAEVATVEQYDNNTSVVNYCTWASGSLWCQDYYTSGWCTNGVDTQAWDYTGCTWKGWSSDGVFCGTGVPGYTAGYEWGKRHTHCN